MKINAKLHRLDNYADKEVETVTSDDYIFDRVPQTFIGGHIRIDTIQNIEINNKNYAPFKTLIKNTTTFELWLVLIERYINDNDLRYSYRMNCLIDFNDTLKVNAIIDDNPATGLVLPFLPSTKNDFVCTNNKVYQCDDVLFKQDSVLINLTYKCEFHDFNSKVLFFLRGRCPHRPNPNTVWRKNEAVVIA